MRRIGVPASTEARSISQSDSNAPIERLNDVEFREFFEAVDGLPGIHAPFFRGEDLVVAVDNDECGKRVISHLHGTFGARKVTYYIPTATL